MGYQMRQINDVYGAIDLGLTLVKARWSRAGRRAEQTGHKICRDGTSSSPLGAGMSGVSPYTMVRVLTNYGGRLIAAG